MTHEVLELALGYIDDQYIIEADDYVPVKKQSTSTFKPWQKWGWLAAGLALIIGIGFYELNGPSKTPIDPNAEDIILSGGNAPTSNLAKHTAKPSSSTTDNSSNPDNSEQKSSESTAPAISIQPSNSVAPTVAPTATVNPSSENSSSSSSSSNDGQGLQAYRNNALEYIKDEIGADIAQEISNADDPSIEILPSLDNRITITNSAHSQSGSYYGVSYKLNDHRILTIWLDENATAIGYYWN